MLPRLLAVLLPLAPLAGLVAASGLLEPDVTELPTPTIGPTARTLLTLDHEAEVLVIGNSQAESAVDPDALGRRLEIAGGVGTVALPGLHADGVYALLKYRVFGAGMRPRVVVVPMSLDHLLDTRPPADHNLRTLMENLPGSDPALDAKEFGAAGGAALLGPRWTRAIGRLQTGRDDLLEHLTSLPLRLLGGAEDPAARMDAARDAALGEVAGANLALQVRVLPAAGAAPQAPRPAPGIERTLLPDIVQLAQDAGARLVIATVPQKVRALGTRPEAAREVAEWLHERGVPFLHLEGMEVPTDAWLDPGHLARKGEALYTDLLADRLIEMHVLQERPLAMPALPILPPKVTRAGDPPPPQILSQVTSSDGCLVHLKLDVPRWRSDTFLAAIGMGYASLLQATAGGQPVAPHLTVTEATGCAGRMWHAVERVALAPPAPGAAVAFAWAGTPSTRRSAPKEDAHLEETVYWLPPGGSLTLSWDTPPEADHLAIALAEINPGQGAPIVAIGGAATPLAAWGKAWSGEIALGARGLADPLVLTSPPGGPELLLTLIAVRRGGVQQLALGQSGDLPWKIELSGTFLMDAAAPVPPTVVARAPVLTGRALVFAVDGPLAALTQDALAAAVGDPRFSGCMPIAARQVGDTSAAQRLVQQVHPGTIAMMVAPGTDDRWELVWRDKRVCSTRAWVMPGETLPIRPRAPGAVFVPTDALLLDLAAFPPQGQARVRLWRGERALVDAEVDLSGPRPVTIPLLEPVPPWPDGVRMEVTAPADVFVSVGLGELRPSQAQAWFAVEAEDAAP